MIISGRISEMGPSKVANVFLSRQVTQHSEDIARSCFRSWDENYIRLKQDLDATKIYAIEDLKDQKLMELHTTTLAALRSLPKEARTTSQLFTVATDFRISDERPRAAWSNLPPWANLFVEGATGSLTQIEPQRFNKSAHNSPWISWNLDPDDLFLHVALFQNKSQFSFSTLANDNSSFFHSRLAPQLAYSNRKLGLVLRACDPG
jgi:hypothetical protein